MHALSPCNKQAGRHISFCSECPGVSAQFLGHLPASTTKGGRHSLAREQGSSRTSALALEPRQDEGNH